MVSCTFKKDEKLCSEKIIGEIFITGRSFNSFPLKIAWIDVAALNSSYPVQAAFSVPKKNFRKAHERNMIKRKMRESYRFLKSALYEFLEKNGQKIALIFVFLGTEDQEFRKIQSAMAKVLDRLQQEMLSEKRNSGT